MIKRTITFTDYNGLERTEDFYFHLTKAELAKMEMSTSGGYAEMITRIVQAKDAPAIMAVFEELIHKSYGVKTPDGRGFVKRKDDLDAFVQTEAYSQLFMDLLTDTEYATKFINGIIPADLSEQAQNAPAPLQLNP